MTRVARSGRSIALRPGRALHHSTIAGRDRLKKAKEWEYRARYATEPGPLFPFVSLSKFRRAIRERTRLLGPPVRCETVERGGQAAARAIPGPGRPHQWEIAFPGYESRDSYRAIDPHPVA